jgi:GDA1/CD39 (nucleoside phosphatase) family
VDQFRDRLWNLIVYEYEKSEQLHVQDTSNNKIVMNPCSNPGHNVTTAINGSNYLLVGTGSVLVCKEYMKRIIPHPIHTPIQHIYDESLRSISSSSIDDNKVVGGIQHPSIYNESPPQQEQTDNLSTQNDSDTPYPDFLAMSLYFFTFDSIRVFTSDAIVNERWPKPTLLELENATIKYCSMDLIHDIYPLYDNDPQKQPHPYTRKGIVQHRCMEAIYMISLLETFGFRSHERHITFAFDVNGSEVEWTLGMALQYYSNNNINTEQDNTCAWDSHGGSHAYPDQKTTRNSNQISFSIVQRVRNYLSKILASDTTSTSTGNAESIASKQ